MQKRLTFLFLLFCATACGVSDEQYQKDLGDLRRQIGDLEDQKGSLIEEKKQLMGQVAALGQEKGTLSGDLASAFRKIEELKEISAKRKALYDKMMTALQSMMGSGVIQIRKERGRLIVAMSEAVLFDTGKSKVKPAGEAALTQLVPVLRDLNRQFEVGGHTDNVGSDDTNWKLSVDRGLSVTRFMISQGMPPERLVAAGYGKFAPRAGNDTEEGRAQNRSIEIVLVPNLEELEIPGE
jgi:chemotaxis protein MotB